MSNINYTGIDENFPVAGQDNDTQTFRDNFDTIKIGLRTANEEITALESSVARVTTDNDFELNVVSRAVLQNNRDQKLDGGTISTALVVDFENGPYQIFRFSVNSNISFLNMPGDPLLLEDIPKGVGKIMLELYGDGTSRTLTFTTSGGTVFKKDPSFPESVTVSSTTDPIFVEAWRHSNEVIFLRYLGQFS